MKVLGITGGSGSGKTTLLEAVRLRGGCGIDCDAVYHRLLKEDGALLHAIGEEFPAAMDGGVLNRKKLGTLVFRDPPALERLNRLTHSRVGAEVKRLLAQAAASGAPLSAIDAIALQESGLAELCDVTVAVLAPVEARIRRLTMREGISEQYARERIGAQKTDAEFAAGCQYVLVNDCTSKEEFLQRCDGLLEQLWR